MPIDPEQAAAKMAQAVRSLRDNMPALLELAQLETTLIRARYVALIEKGFTPEQALHLCVRKVEL